METNPYAPPKAVVADVSSDHLKRRSVILRVLFFFVTVGLYLPIWFLRRRAALNRLDSPRKLRRWPFVIALVWFAFQFVLGTITGSAPLEKSIGSAAAILFAVSRAAVGILMIVQSFFTKDILEDHLAGPDDQVPHRLFAETVKLSGVMTFFFQIFYLQYSINRYIADAKPRTA